MERAFKLLMESFVVTYISIALAVFLWEGF